MKQLIVSIDLQQPSVDVKDGVTSNDSEEPLPSDQSFPAYKFLKNPTAYPDSIEEQQKVAKIQRQMRKKLRHLRRKLKEVKKANASIKEEKIIKTANEAQKSKAALLRVR